MHDIAQVMGGPRLIKRYPNRKLYDTLDRRYVSLADLAEVLEGGHDVRVIDHRTSRDLTRTTLAALLLRRERRAARQADAAAQQLAVPHASDPACDGDRRARELVERAATARARAEQAWSECRDAAAGLRPHLDARLGEAWGVVAELGKVNRELRWLRSRLDELDERVRVLRSGPREVGARLGA